MLQLLFLQLVDLSVQQSCCFNYIFYNLVSSASMLSLLWVCKLIGRRCQNCIAWLVPSMRTRSILEFLSLDKKLFKGVCLSFIFLGLLLVYFIVFVYI